MTSLCQSVAGGRVPRIVAAIRFAFLPVLAAGITSQAGAEIAAHQRTTIQYDIPAGSLSDALSLFALQSEIALAFEVAAVQGIETQGLRGLHSIEEGFDILLRGSGYTAIESRTGYRLVWRPQVAQASTPADAQRMTDVSSTAAVLPTLTVTGEDGGFKARYQTSATKSPQSIRETPQSISVVTQDNLKARQVFDFGQALQTSAGVSLFEGAGPFAGQGGSAAEQFQIRGIDLGRSGGREDGFRSPTFGTPPDLAPYERIEVVKGPASTLYGRGAAGGFINRVRKTPLPEFHAELAPTIGSFDFYRLDGDVTGPLFGSENVRGRVVAAYESAGSFVDGVKGDREVIAPSLELDLAARTRLLLQGTYQRDEFFPNPGVPLVTNSDGSRRAPNVSRSFYAGVPNENANDSSILSSVATLEQGLGDDWLATLKLNRTANELRGGAEVYAFGFFGDGDTYLFGDRISYDSDLFSGELLLNGRVNLLGRPATLTAGVDYAKFKFKQGYVFDIIGSLYDDPPPNIYLNNFADFPIPVGQSDVFGADNEQTGTGVFAQFQFRPFERMSVLLGGRYDQVRTFRRTRTLIPPLRRDNAFTGRAALSFDVWQNVSVYGMFAQSFEPVNVQGGSVIRDPDTQQIIGSELGDILEPETGEIYEVGVKTEWLDGRFGINAAVFRLERDKIPIPVNLPPGIRPGFSVSSGLQVSTGVELEINGEPLPGWNVSFGGTLLDSEFTNGPFEGSPPIGAADWQVGLFTSYELQGGPLRGLGAGMGLYAIDDRGVSVLVPNSTIDGYERVDLSLFYNGFKNTRIALQVRNVFDERYIEAASDGESSSAYFGSPPAVLLTVRYTFGE